MFISKKKFKESQDLLLAYKEKHSEQLSEISILKDRVKKLEKVLTNQAEDNANLIKENKKLTDWIQKIITEVGCYEVNDNCRVTIPIMKMDGPAYDTDFNGNEYIVNRQTITLPEITFTKETRR